jgi:SiaC family regulatory phosphoprotein
MEPLFLEGTEDTPEINFDAEKKIFSIADRSLPENAVDFYKPVFEWLEEYKEQADKEINFDFKLDYFNTSSAKQITKILLFLEKLALDSNVIIRWYYRKEDVDMLSSGSRYAKLINVKFELIEF